MIDAGLATLLAGGLAIAGSILGVVLGAAPQRQAERADRVRRDELHALERLERHLKRIAAIATANVWLPTPIAGYGLIGVLRDMVYADPSIIPDEEAARDLLDVVQETVIDVTPLTALRRWFAPDHRHQQEMITRRTDIELRLATSIVERRCLIVSGHRRRSAPAVSNDAPSGHV